jgi:hypothetical protein
MKTANINKKGIPQKNRNAIWSNIELKKTLRDLHYYFFKLSNSSKTKSKNTKNCTNIFQLF